MRWSVIPVARWSCPGRTAVICCRRWLTSRCLPRRPGSLVGLHQRTDRSGRSGWRAAGTGNTRSCRHRRGGDSCHHTPRKRVIGLSAPTYPGILFIRTIVLMVRAAMFLSFGRRCLARTFQSAKHRRRMVFIIIYYTQLHIFKHSHPERWNCADLSIWEFPRRTLARPRVSVDSRLSRSRKTVYCPMCRLAGWTPVWNRSGLRSHTAAGKPALVSASAQKIDECKSYMSWPAVLGRRMHVNSKCPLKATMETWKHILAHMRGTHCLGFILGRPRLLYSLLRCDAS